MRALTKLTRPGWLAAGLAAAFLGGGYAYAATAGTPTATKTGTIATTTENKSLSATAGVTTTTETFNLPPGAWLPHAADDLVNFGPPDFTRCAQVRCSHLGHNGATPHVDAEASFSAHKTTAAKVDVLTVSKVGGTNVKVGDIVKASLVSGTKATFTTTSGSVLCSASRFSAKVTANPARPGKARESLTALSFTSCSPSNFGGVESIPSVTVGNLSFNATVSDAKGFPVTISGTSSIKPLQVTIVFKSFFYQFTCVYTAPSISGNGSNTGNAVSFTNQKFTLAGVPALCPSSGFFTAKYGPVTDSSKTGSPKVFVN